MGLSAIGTRASRSPRLSYCGIGGLSMRLRAGRLILSTRFGIPFGLLMLTSVPEPVVKAALAAVIMTFSAYRLLGQSQLELKGDRMAWLFGFLAGVLGAHTA